MKNKPKYVVDYRFIQIFFCTLNYLLLSTTFKTSRYILLMTSRHIIEREGLYFRDQLTARTALQNLNFILETERPDSEIIFYQSQSEVPIDNSINQYSISTTPLFAESLFDGTIFSTSNSQVQATSEKLQDSQMMNSQDLQLPKQMSTTKIETQNIDQKSVSEDSYGESSESNESLYGKQKKMKRSVKKPSQKKIDKEKNIFPNIAKRNAKIMFDDCRAFTIKYLQKRNINFEDFAKEYQSLMESNCSGLSLSEYFTVNEGNRKMSLLFMKLFEKYLRKRYMVVAMKKGKMTDVKNYIGCKNRQLMYFSSYVNSQFQRGDL